MSHSGQQLATVLKPHKDPIISDQGQESWPFDAEKKREIYLYIYVVTCKSDGGGVKCTKENWLFSMVKLKRIVGSEWGIWTWRVRFFCPFG